MSGIAGIFNMDGAPIDPVRLGRMAEALRNRGSDGLKTWSEGPAGLAHTHFRTTPEEVGEEQPISSADGRYTIAADARIDNRNDLMASLRVGSKAEPPSDAQLILAAYQKWGSECPEHLIGDFAFLIWNAPERRLFAARDVMGIRQLVHCRSGSSLYFGTNVGAVVAGLDEPLALNYPFAQDFIAYRFDRWTEETIYKGIERLPPAHCLDCSAEGSVRKRYWILGARRPIRYKTEADYIERFRELLTEAVRARMRSQAPVGLLVSGGLDSSSIACLMESLVGQGEPAKGRLYSVVFDETPKADERIYLNAVLDRCPSLPATLLPGDGCWAMRDFGEYRLDEPWMDLNRLMAVRPMRQARVDGCRVVLNGTWGDEVLHGAPYHDPTVLRDLPLSYFREELPYFRQKCNRSAAMLLAYKLLRPATPASIRRLLSERDENGLALTSPLRRATRDRIASPLAPPRLGGHVARGTYDSFMCGQNSARCFFFDSLQANSGVEIRPPFADARLVEFALALPVQLLMRHGTIKYILRRSLADLLPEVLLRPRPFSTFSELVDRGLRSRERPRIEALLEDSRVVETGLVDVDTLKKAWTLYWGDRGMPDSRPLVVMLCLEEWLRQERGARAIR